MKPITVLLAEHDFFVATDLAFELERRGMAVTVIATSLHETLTAIAEKRPGFALLNIAFPDGDSYPAARRLRDLKIPFAFLTGFDAREIPDEFRQIPRVAKPQDPQVIAASVLRHANGSAGSDDAPPGMHP